MLQKVSTTWERIDLAFELPQLTLFAAWMLEAAAQINMGTPTEDALRQYRGLVPDMDLFRSNVEECADYMMQLFGYEPIVLSNLQSLAFWSGARLCYSSRAQFDEYHPIGSYL